MINIPDNVVSKVLSLRNYTTSAIKDLQKGLIPYVTNPEWKIIENGYLFNGKRNINRDKKIKILKVFGVKVKNNSVTTDFDENIKDAIDKRYIDPFIIFVNGLMVTWDRIRVLFNGKDIYLKINIKEPITSFNSIHICDNDVHYNTDGEESFIYGNTLFRFDITGEYNKNGKVIYAIRSDKILQYEAKVSDVVKSYHINIDDKIKLFKDNFISFKDGKLDTSLKVEVKDLNITTLNDGEPIDNYNIKVFYSFEYNHSISNSCRLVNYDYIRKSESGSIESGIDFSLLFTEFDFEMKSTYSFDKNVDFTLDKIYEYNPMITADMYDDESFIKTMNYKGRDILAVSDENYMAEMLRLKYNGTETYVIIFKDGLLYSEYYTIEYDINTFRFSAIGISDGDDIEIVYYQNINNTIIEANFEEGEHIEDHIIKFNNMLVLSSYCEELQYPLEENENVLYDIHYEIINKSMYLYNDNYYNRDVILCAKNQFRYRFMTVEEDTHVINLPTIFNTCLDEDNYMIFINGRFVNKAYYKLLIPKYNNPITELVLYSGIELTAWSRIEIIYQPVAQKYIDTTFDVRVEFVDVLAEVDNQKTFKIPYPYTGYIKKDNGGFLVSVGSILLNPSKYSIINEANNIVLSEDTYLMKNSALTFVFIFTVMNDIDSYSVSAEDMCTVYSKYVDIDSDDQLVFNIPESTNGFILSLGSTIVDKRRYQVDHENRTITMFEAFDKLESGRKLSFIYSRNSLGEEVEFKSKVITAKEDDQSIFEIPILYIANGNSMVIRNSIIVPKTDYTINDRHLIFYDKKYYLNKDDVFNIIYIENEDINDNKSIVIDAKYVNILKDNVAIYNIPLIYSEVKYTKTSFLVFIGSVLIDSKNYDVLSNNKILFKDKDILIKNRTITFLFIYNTIESFKINGGLTERDYISIELQPIEFTMGEEDGQSRIQIPKTSTDINSDFFLIRNSTLFSNQRYETLYTYSDEENIVDINEEEDYLKYNQSMFAVLIYQQFQYFNKINLNTTLVRVEYDRQNEFILPFEVKTINDSKSFMIFSGTTLINPSRYFIDFRTNKIIINDPEFYPIEGNTLDILLFSTSYTDNSIFNIPESGYLYCNKNKLDFPLDKRLYFMFLNGKKINTQDIIDISPNMLKIGRDYLSKHDLVLLSNTKRIPYLKSYLENSNSNWEKFLSQLHPMYIDILYDNDSNITTGEDDFTSTISDSVLISEINTKYYLPYD